MIYKKPGEEFWHEGICYKVGGRIVANEASDYAGLFGNILEIRTEDDRETENDTPDIYCAFEAPVLSADRLALEQTFSQLYHEQKHIEDLGLDMVIMGPEMIAPLEHPAQVYPAGTLYVVIAHWATDGEYGSYEAIFTERTDALHQFHNDLGKNFWLEAFHAGKKAASSSKKSLTAAMSAIWTANTVRTIFRLRWNSGRCLFPLHFAAARQNCTAQNACGMISGSILRTVTIFKSSLTHRKKHCCVLPICRSGSPTSWNTAAPTVRLTGRRCPMWHALC